ALPINLPGCPLVDESRAVPSAKFQRPASPGSVPASPLNIFSRICASVRALLQTRSSAIWPRKSLSSGQELFPKYLGGAVFIWLKLPSYSDAHVSTPLT